MKKENIIRYRDNLFKGMPMIIICDNDHNFFDNYPGKPFPVWDDANECVTYLEMYHQQGGIARTDEYPFATVLVDYEQIQFISALSDKSDVMRYLAKNKAALGADKYRYSLEMVSKVFRNTRPTDPRPYGEEDNDNSSN